MEVGKGGTAVNDRLSVAKSGAANLLKLPFFSAQRLQFFPIACLCQKKKSSSLRTENEKIAHTDTSKFTLSLWRVLMGVGATETALQSVKMGAHTHTRTERLKPTPFSITAAAG